MELRKTIILFILFAMTVGAFAQQDPQFTQNMFNRLYYNPAYAGSNGALCGTAIHRQQNTSFTGTPITTALGIEAAFNAKRLYMNQSGIGLYVMQDQLGAEDNLTAKIAYSHLIKPNFIPGYFRIGVEGGIINKSLSDEWVSEVDAQFDPAITNASALVPDIGFGIYYYTRNYYIGASSGHITEPTFNETVDNNEFNYDLDRHYYVMGGYYYDFNTPTPMQLQPSFLVKSSLNATQVDINCNFLYNKFVWGGLSGRPETGSFALAALAGIDFTEQVPELSGFKVGLAYDYNLSDISKDLGGSFEIMLNYCYKIIVPPKRQKYRSVIWL